MKIHNKLFTPPHLIFTLILALSVFTGCQVESNEDEKATYTVTYNVNGGSGEMKALTAEEGTEITLTANAFTREGFTFSGWATTTDGNIVHTDGAKITLTENLTLYAKWNPNAYKVRFCDDSGNADDTIIETTYDTEFALPETTTLSKTGYNFYGWNTEPDGSGKNFKPGEKVKNLATEAGTVTLYVRWLEKGAHTITYVLNGGTNDESNPETFLERNAVELKDLSRTFYEFAGWYDNADFSGDKLTGWNAGEKTGDITLYAKWTAISYKIIYKNAENASNSNPETYTIETAVTLAAPTKDGSDFIGWYKEDSFETKVTEIAKGSTGDITLYAKFVSNSYLFYSQKWNYADDDFGVALPAKLELKRSIAAGDTLGAPFAENAVAFCTAGVWGEDDTVVYYVDGDYALWSYSADGTKTQVKEAVAGAKGAFVSYDSEGKCLFALYGFSDTSNQKVFVKDTVSGKSFTVVYGNVTLKGGITAIAGSKKDSSFFIANGRGSNMNICPLKFSSSFSTMLDSGSEFSDEITGGEIFGLGSETLFTTSLKKDPIQYKITDMTVLGGKLYALFASCFESRGEAQDYTDDYIYYYYPYGNYSTAGGVLRINYSGNLSVDTTFGTDGVAGYSKNINKKYNPGTSTTYLFPYPDYDVYERTFSTEWPTARINSNLEFNNPQKIVAIKPDELVIAENGLALTVDDNDNRYSKHYNLARAVTMDLNGKIKSVTAVHGKSFSYGGYDNDDGLVVSSTARNTELHNDIQFE